MASPGRTSIAQPASCFGSFGSGARGALAFVGARAVSEGSGRLASMSLEETCQDPAEASGCVARGREAVLRELVTEVLSNNLPMLKDFERGGPSDEHKARGCSGPRHSALFPIARGARSCPPSWSRDATNVEEDRYSAGQTR